MKENLTMLAPRKYLSAAGLLSIARKSFSRVSDRQVSPERPRAPTIPLVDCLMSGLAVFGLKSPSLLQFDNSIKQSNIAHNLKTLYGLQSIPSDTQMRTRLDVLEPQMLRKAFTSIFAMAQRGKALEDYVYYEGHYLLSLDGTGQYNSEKVQCENCCVKHHRNGKVSYYHQMLGAVIVHPKRKIVIPLAPEPITKQDGATKNDCERNAAKRLLTHIRTEHPHLKFIVIEDGLSSNAPHIELIKSLKMRFILGVKPDDHKYLFDWVKHSACTEYEEIDIDGVKHRYRFINDVPLNEAREDVRVNFLEYWEEKPDGRIQHFSWVTDITLHQLNVKHIMRGGRARWKIENETFNTLKNQGYNFEHNYGHGNKNLCSVFTLLMMLAFLIDQIQELCCALYKAVRLTRTKNILFAEIRFLFEYYAWSNWVDLFTAMVNIKNRTRPPPS